MLRDSAAEGLPSLAGVHDVSDASDFLQLLAGGALLTVRDYADYEPLPSHTRQKFVALGFRSMMAAPLVKDGQLIATLLVGDTQIRDWSASEASLLADVAERTWAAVERARAEAALRRSEKRFRQFVDASSDILWIRDANTFEMEFASPAIAPILGVTPQEVMADPRLMTAIGVQKLRTVPLLHLFLRHDFARSGSYAGSALATPFAGCFLKSSRHFFRASKSFRKSASSGTSTGLSLD